MGGDNTIAASPASLGDLRIIRGVHGVFFTPEAEEARRFVKDKLELAQAGARDGWAILPHVRATGSSD